ncbi:MAG TPA: hypothetical protein VN176_13070 [Verrucomicrobiae bacterium]|jgi:hypothetical protein|nr:hypothetical protein [Verrucomicrobiae bacterium]
MKTQNRRTAILMIATLTAAFTVVHAQNAPAPAVNNALQADIKEVDSIEHIVGAVYDCISGPPGPRNWDRFRSLYYPGARMIPSFRDAKGAIAARSSTVDEYAERAGAYFAKEGFYESPLANRIETWDHIAHVWSTYESRHAKGDKPFARGINSFQLMYDGTRWWILTVYWEGEDAGHPLSDKYLK